VWRPIFEQSPAQMQVRRFISWENLFCFSGACVVRDLVLPHTQSPFRRDASFFKSLTLYFHRQSTVEEVCCNVLRVRLFLWTPLRRMGELEYTSIYVLDGGALWVLHLGRFSPRFTLNRKVGGSQKRSGLSESLPLPGIEQRLLYPTGHSLCT
jgi:hypothetical protein